MGVVTSLTRGEPVFVFERTWLDGGRRLCRCERGAEQMEYLLVLAAIVLPMIVAARLLWVVLLYYFTLESLVIDLPFF